jgi:sporadic carbohydrate cluster 2OG-Fe(II) oxygenase
MSDISEFFSSRDLQLGEQFLKKGYVIADVEDFEFLADIQSLISLSAGKYLNTIPDDHLVFLNNVHHCLPGSNLNDLRLHVIDKMGSAESLRPKFFALARTLLESIVGNELSMQLRLNLSIQLPEDSSSLLPVHADVWSGDAPFEVVVWLPLVDCYRSKSMFILPPDPTDRLHAEFAEYQGRSSEDIFQDIKEEVDWLELSYGQVLLFNQNLPHGNRVNSEAETRWSINCRFKSVFSPYSDKKLGEFFEPITLRPASKVGVGYRFPDLQL